jgi:hypothetical protein
MAKVKAHSQQSRKLNSKHSHSTFKLGRWFFTGTVGLFLVCLTLLVVLNIQLTSSTSNQASQARLKLKLNQKEHHLLDQKPRETSKEKTKRSHTSTTPRHGSIQRTVDVDAGSNNNTKHHPSGIRPPPPKIVNTNNAFQTTTPPPPPDETHYQLIFSTSCHYLQDWQSYLFFFQVLRVKQSGDVTRIVSGCTPEQEQELREIFNAQIKPMSDRFHVHFTPEYGKQVGNNFQQTKYWNKPFGVKHWLEHALGYSDDDSTSKNNNNKHDDDIIILVDPDMLLQRPFVNDFSQSPNDIWTTFFRRKEEDPSKKRITKVAHGSPMAQMYGFGTQWLKAGSHNLSYVVGDADSPVLKVSLEDAGRFYPAGPPYLLTARDMYQVSVKWTEFLPRLWKLSPKFMAEMYGYSLAAAHLQLPHQLARGFMISSVAAQEGEGWYFLKDVPPEAICDRSKPVPNVPHVLHFCQRYGIGEYFISKYRIPHLLTCDMPLPEVPPTDAALMNYTHYGDGTTEAWPASKRTLKHGNAFMVCTLYAALNDASRYFKQHHCENPNMNETYRFFEWEEQEKQEKQRAKEANKNH